MGDFLKKAIERGLTPSNVFSWLCLEGGRRFGALFGILRLLFKAALLGVRLGKGVKAHGTVSLMRWPGSSIQIGDGVSLIGAWRRATAAPLSHPVRLRSFGPNAKIVLGEGCELSGTAITCRSTSIVLGRRVLVGPDVVITDSDFHAPWPVERRPGDPGMERDAPVFIGDGAWIGMRCTILKGVHVGEGAIIGAGSVVTRDIPPFALACGNPCRVVRLHDKNGEIQRG